MKHHSLYAGLVLAFLASLPAEIKAQFTYVTNNGTLTITGYIGPGGEVLIPDTIDGLPVTTIGGSAFAFNSSLTRVTISSAVTSIQSGAFFQCLNLTSATLPNSVTAIGDQAFSLCGLRSVTVPGSVTNLGDGVFRDCMLTNVAILGNIGNIGIEAFYGNVYLATVSLPSTITNIGPRAFYSCWALTNFVLPNSVLNIDEYALYGCTSLSAITLPSSITNVGPAAFNNCSSLTSVTIGRGVASIGPQAFGNCPKLAAITVDALNSNFSSVNGVLFSRDQIQLIQFPSAQGGSFAIPTSVSTIAPGAFAGCRLESIVIPAGLTAMDPGVFFSCGKLASINVEPGNAAYMSIDGVLFSHDQASLLVFPRAKEGGYLIPNSVMNIDAYAFTACANLTNVTIGSSVTNIGTRPFDGCLNLFAITVSDSNPAFSSLDGVLFDKNQTTIIAFPRAKGGSYVIPGTITSIESGVFGGHATLTNLVIASGVRNIGNFAFQYCSSLRSIVIPSTVTNIGIKAFYECGNLRDAAIPNGVVSIDNHAFAETGLMSITIPDSVVTIGSSAFMECRSVTNVIIGKGVASIEEGAFYTVGRFNFNRIGFLGNAPVLTSFPPWEPPGVFHPDATIYYLPGTSGWTSSFGGRPTALWHLSTPTILTLPPYFGVQTNQFGFRVSWATNRTTVIEACTNLASPSWVPLATNSLISFLWFYFSDPEWTNFPNRIYRVRQQ